MCMTLGAMRLLVIFIDFFLNQFVLLKPVSLKVCFIIRPKGRVIYKLQKVNPLETETVSKMNYTQNEHKECVPATLQDVGIIINIF